MERRMIKEFVTLIPGINPTRAGKKYESEELHYYDQQSFEGDYKHIEEFVEKKLKTLSPNNSSLNEGDVVVSNSLQLATMVGKSNAGKVLSLNFTKIEFDKKLLDKRYFLFLFNTFNDVRRQKERELQGTGSVLRIPLRAMEEILIPVVSLEEQKRIGAIYTETLKLQSRLNKYADLMELFTCSILEETLKGE